MAPSTSKGAWTPEEDQRLTSCIQTHGPKRWKTVAARAGLSRCGKSCRLRWLNYLRPNIKRGCISSEEEDLIFRLHRLLGNRWSLIAGRLPGRTDNEIKNYWNSHLSKKEDNQKEDSPLQVQQNNHHNAKLGSGQEEECENSGSGLDVVDTFLDFSGGDGEGGSLDLEWVKMFFEVDDYHNSPPSKFSYFQI